MGAASNLHRPRELKSAFYHSGRYVTLSSSKDTGRSNLLWIADLEESKIGSEMKWHKVINEWGDYWADIGNDGSLFYFFTKCAALACVFFLPALTLSHPQRQRLAQLQDRDLRLGAPREGEYSGFLALM